METCLPGASISAEAGWHTFFPEDGVLDACGDDSSETWPVAAEHDAVSMLAKVLAAENGKG
jgi:hypothetical protein